MNTRKIRPAAQLAMFQTEDLPLFSGTPQAVKAQVFDPKPAAPKPASMAACSFCLDTGMLGMRLYCWCAAGTAAKQRPAIDALAMYNQRKQDEQNHIELAFAKVGAEIDDIYPQPKTDGWYVKTKHKADTDRLLHALATNSPSAMLSESPSFAVSTIRNGTSPSSAIGAGPKPAPPRRDARLSRLGRPR